MATRLYLPSAGFDAAVSHSFAGCGWYAAFTGHPNERTYTTKPGDALATVLFDINQAVETDMIVARYVSLPVTPGQTLTASTVAAFVRCKAYKAVTLAAVAKSLAFSVAVVNASGTVVHVAVSATRDSGAAAHASLAADSVSATVDGSYTFAQGDRLSICLGFGGTELGGVYYEMRLGSSAASDIVTLGSTTDLNPYVEFSQTLTFQTSVDAGTGEFTVGGQDAGMIAGRLPLVADAGEFVVDGQDATLTFGVVIEAEAGSFGVAGEDADLVATRLLDGEAGSFTVSGQDAELVHGFSAEAEAGAFVLDGQDAEFAVSKGIICDVGEFGVAGQDASLVYSGEHLYRWRSPRESMAWMMIDEAGGTR